MLNNYLLKLLVAIGFLSFLASANASECVQGKDSLVFNDDRWFLAEESVQAQQPYTGCMEQYHSDGQLLLRASFKAGLRHGKEEAWYPDGKRRHIVYFREGQPQSYGSVWFSAMPPKKKEKRILFCDGSPDNPACFGDAPVQESQLVPCGSSRC